MSVDPSLLLRLDESIRTDLQAIRDGFFEWLLVSAGIVLIGVLLEGPEVIREVRKKAVLVFPNIWSVHRAVSAPESRLGKLFKFLSFIGWFVLVFGLVGEGVFESLVSRADGQLQRFDNILLADAIRYASAANERSKSLENENLRLRTILGPRHLTEEQRKRLAELAKEYAGMPIDVYVVPEANETNAGKEEAVAFAEEIVNALHPMDVAGRFGLFCQPWPVVGVIASGPQDLSRDRFAIGYIFQVFRLEHMEYTPVIPAAIIPPCANFSGLGKATKRIGLAKINIIIGRKPAPILKENPRAGGVPLNAELAQYQLRHDVGL